MKPTLLAGRFEMSAALGPVRVLGEDREVFLGRDYLASADVSQPTLEALDAEVRRILDQRRQAARALLVAHRAALDAVAAALLEGETLEGADLEGALGPLRPAGGPPAQAGVPAPAPA